MEVALLIIYSLGLAIPLLLLSLSITRVASPAEPCATGHRNRSLRLWGDVDQHGRSAGDQPVAAAHGPAVALVRAGAMAAGLGVRWLSSRRSVLQYLLLLACPISMGAMMWMMMRGMGNRPAKPRDVARIRML